MSQVSAGTTVFQVRGKVVYTDPNTASGVEFRGVESRYQAVLEWLLETKGINKSDEH